MSNILEASMVQNYECWLLPYSIRIYNAEECVYVCVIKVYICVSVHVCMCVFMGLGNTHMYFLCHYIILGRFYDVKHKRILKYCS